MHNHNIPCILQSAPTVPLLFLCISYNISGKFIIGLYKHKETAALKIKAAVSNGRVDMAALRRFFLLPSRGR